MSETLAQAESRIRYITGDLDPAALEIQSSELRRIIIARAQLMGADVGLGSEWVASAITLTAGSSADVDMPTSVQYAHVAMLRNATRGTMLFPKSLAEINEMREGLTATSTETGYPRFFATWEDSSQVVKVRLDCLPIAADVLDAMRSALPATTYTDATVLPFADSFLRAIEYAAAKEMSARMGAAGRERIGLGTEVMAEWDQAIAVGVGTERKRKANLKRAPWPTRDQFAWMRD